MSDRGCAWGEGCSTLICIAMHCILMCILALQTHCILTCILNFSLHLHPFNGLVGVGVFGGIRCACVGNVHSSLYHCCFVDARGLVGSWEGPVEMLKDNMGGGVELHYINNTIAHCQMVVWCFHAKCIEWLYITYAFCGSSAVYLHQFHW